MANPNDITRRSDKSTFLTFEEMDLNLDALKDLVIDYDNIYNTILPGLTDRVGDVELDLSEYKVEVNNRFNEVVSTNAENTFTKEQIFTDNVQMVAATVSNLTISTTFRLPRWKNDTRPNNPLYGMFGYNADISNLEFYNGNVWITLHDPAVTEAEAESGTSTSYKRWSPKLIRDAITGWWDSITNSFSRGLIEKDAAYKARNHLGLGTAATRDVGESSGNVMEVGAFGLGGFPVSFSGSSFEDQLTHNMMTVQRGTGDFPSDSPEYGAVKALAIGHIGKWESHLAFAAYRNNLYLRSRSSSGGSFLPWVKIHHTGNILTTTGQSTEYPMSQKAVSDELAKKLESSDITPEITGSTTFTKSTNQLVLTDVVTTLSLEIGDVIDVTGASADSGQNNGLRTVESITDDDTIILNYEHRNGAGSLSLADETKTVTVKRIAKWFNAPIGLGQAIVSVARSMDITYTNSTNRSLTIIGQTILGAVRSAGFTIDGIYIGHTSFDASNGNTSNNVVVTPGATYQYNGNIVDFWEVR